MSHICISWMKTQNNKLRLNHIGRPWVASPHPTNALMSYQFNLYKSYGTRTEIKLNETICIVISIITKRRYIHIPKQITRLNASQTSLFNSYSIFPSYGITPNY